MSNDDKCQEVSPLVVTRGGVPVADQAQGVRDFIAASRAPPAVTRLYNKGSEHMKAISDLCELPGGPPCHEGPVETVADLRVVIERSLWAAYQVDQIVSGSSFLRGQRVGLIRLLERIDGAS